MLFHCQAETTWPLKCCAVAVLPFFSSLPFSLACPSLHPTCSKKWSQGSLIKKKSNISAPMSWSTIDWKRRYSSVHCVCLRCWRPVAVDQKKGSCTLRLLSLKKETKSKTKNQTIKTSSSSNNNSKNLTNLYKIQLSPMQRDRATAYFIVFSYR